jgi:hypothetical protein
MLSRICVLLLALSAPAAAIVIGYNATDSGTFGDPNSSTYTVSCPTATTCTEADGVNLSGVVELSNTNEGTCTGELLSDGVSILTAAHCVTPGLLETVYFNFPGCSNFPYCGDPYYVSSVADFFVDPSYTGVIGAGNDLAVIQLSSPAPAFATRYSLFTGNVNSIDLDTPIELAGAGISGQGEQNITDYPDGPYIRQGENNYIGTCNEFIAGCSQNVLLAEFYADSPLNNQVEIAGGDSGGPSFYDGQLIGVHEFTDCAPTSNEGVCSITPPDDGYSVFGDTYVGGSNAAWIESVEVATPEPASAALLAIGIAAGLWIRRRRARAAVR